MNMFSLLEVLALLLAGGLLTFGGTVWLLGCISKKYCPEDLGASVAQIIGLLIGAMGIAVLGQAIIM